MTRREPCPIHGCLDLKAGGHGMCRRHWRMVPAVMRQAVNIAWKVVKSLTGQERAYLAAVGRWVDAGDAAKAHVANLETHA